MRELDLYAMCVLIVSLVVATLAVARLTVLLVDDQITNGYRRWVVNRWGENSLPSYLVHCPWCTSVWIAVLIMPVTTILATRGEWWPLRIMVAALAVPAASMVAGLLLDQKGD